MATDWYYGTGGNDTTGDGTSHATRWLTMQKIIDSATTGQANIAHGTGGETLSASLDFTTRPYTPTIDNFIKFAGYSTVKGDGGIYALDGGTNEIINNDALDAVHFQGFKFTNWGAGTAFSLDNNCSFVANEFDGEGVRARVIDIDNACLFEGNKVHGIALNGHALSFPGEGCTVRGNYIQIDSSTASDQILRAGTMSIVEGNVMSLNNLNATTPAINILNDTARVRSNTIFNRGTIAGVGILLDGSGVEDAEILSNIISGMATGVSAPAGSIIRLYGNNKFYNNTANESLSGTVVFDLGNNSALGSNPFTSTGNADHNDDDWTVDTTVKAAGYPSGLYDPDGTFGDRNLNYLDCGALQREEAGGGGGTNSILGGGSLSGGFA